MGSTVLWGEGVAASATALTDFRSVGSGVGMAVTAGVIGGASAFAGGVACAIGSGADYYDCANVAAAGSVLHGGSYLAGEGVNAVSGLRKVSSRPVSEELSIDSPRYLEYKTLRQQGYNAKEAFDLMKQFDSGANPNQDWAFHFTNAKGGAGIVSSGEIRQSSGFTLRNPGVYAGTTSTPSFMLKRTPLLGWGLARNSPVRIPIHIPSQSIPIDGYSFLPPKTIVFRGDVPIQH
ncbi:MAG: hypothetical protein GY943_04330 [Chloroflexi bacterium]|nr:hypothetical protein [Chloroflexota bacterium]